MTSEVGTADAKHIFIDIVKYTQGRSVEAQSDLIATLNAVVKKSVIENGINDDDVIYIPTGDGMCISLINVQEPYDAHIKVALSVLENIGIHNANEDDLMRRFSLRVGINENTDNLITDINGHQNISGAGINYASRIEGLCDDNQILVGNSVYEKLSQRERYMGSFSSFDADVKHGVPLRVHQYRNDDMGFLNSSIPSAFRVVPKEEVKLTKLQAYYFANCIKFEEFLVDNVKSGHGVYPFQVLMMQASDDAVARSEATKISPDPTIKVKRDMQEHLAYIRSVDFWLVCDLASCYVDMHLRRLSKYFSSSYVFVNDEGKSLLKKSFPEIIKEYELDI